MALVNPEYEPIFWIENAELNWINLQKSMSEHLSLKELTIKHYG